MTRRAITEIDEHLAAFDHGVGGPLLPTLRRDEASEHNAANADSKHRNRARLRASRFPL